MKRIDKALELIKADTELWVKCAKTLKDLTKENIINRMCPSDFGLNEYMEKCTAYSECENCKNCWNEEVDVMNYAGEELAKKISENTKLFFNEKEIDKFKQITKEMHDLYLIKNKNYGNSFSKQFEEYGLTSVCIRLEDKLNRLKSLNKQGKEANADDESIKDTLIDLANYSVLAIMEISKEE